LSFDLSQNRSNIRFQPHITDEKRAERKERKKEKKKRKAREEKAMAAPAPAVKSKPPHFIVLDTLGTIVFVPTSHGYMGS
jgi:hypothetical protein